MPAHATTPAYAPEVTVWADERHASVVAALLDLMGRAVTPIGVGGPRDGGTDKLAETLGVHRYDDLRQMLVERPAAYLLLAVDDDESPADLAAALAAGTTVLSLEPCCSTLAGYAELDRPPRAAGDTPGIPARAVFLPRFTHTPGFLAATDFHDALGDRRSLLIRSVGPRHDGSLFTRLHDAWATALAFCDTPEAIHAVRTEPPDSTGPYGDSPRALAGRIAANAQCPAGSSITLIAADHAPPLTRELTVVGDQALLTVSPAGYRLRSNDGKTHDQLDPANTPPALDQMADQWRRLLDHRGPGTNADAPGTRRDRQALACTLAAILSAKTGQPESPDRVMQMSRG